jgi:hypothetical protein
MGIGVSTLLRKGWGMRCAHLKITMERMGHEVCPLDNYYGKDGP